MKHVPAIFNDVSKAPITRNEANLFQLKHYNTKMLKISQSDHCNKDYDGNIEIVASCIERVLSALVQAPASDSHLLPPHAVVEGPLIKQRQ